jgi:site-specific recombinase XerD
MKGPKISPYSQLPQRLDGEQLEALWRAAAARRGAYSRQLWVTVLALLYGAGLRRGELVRLDLDCYDRSCGTLRVDGRKTGQERCVPLPELRRSATDCI